MKILDLEEILMVIMGTFIVGSECVKSTLKEFLKNMTCSKWYLNTLIEALISLEHVDKKLDTVLTRWLQRPFPKIKKFHEKMNVHTFKSVSMHLKLLLILQIWRIWTNWRIKRQIECTHTSELKTSVNSLILKISDLQ